MTKRLGAAEAAEGGCDANHRHVSAVDHPTPHRQGQGRGQEEVLDGAVQRCAECNGAFTIVGARNDDVQAIRDAARQGRYLAERVTHAREVDPAEIGHRPSCSRKDT